jgi:hypothetical protein
LKAYHHILASSAQILVFQGEFVRVNLHRLTEGMARGPTDTRYRTSCTSGLPDNARRIINPYFEPSFIDVFGIA